MRSGSSTCTCAKPPLAAKKFHRAWCSNPATGMSSREVGRAVILLMWIALSASAADLKTTNELRITGTKFVLNGAHFPYTGVSFFNALYNPTFNKSSDERQKWLQKFQKYGINVLRVWGQWDSRRGYADTCPECTLYFTDGRLRQPHVETLKQILVDAGKQKMAVELVFFSQESWHDNIRVGPEESVRAIRTLSKELLPYRNVMFQVWNEFDERTLDHVKTMRAADPKRLVTNSPGGAGVVYY